jgi:predicted DNA-binding transcriptional regulator AlpA
MPQHDASTRACRHCGRSDARAEVEPLVVSERQAAMLISLSPSKLRDLRDRGLAPPAIWLSERRLGYRLADVRAWLAARPPA